MVGRRSRRGRFLRRRSGRLHVPGGRSGATSGTVEDLAADTGEDRSGGSSTRSRRRSAPACSRPTSRTCSAASGRVRLEVPAALRPPRRGDRPGLGEGGGQGRGGGGSRRGRDRTDLSRHLRLRRRGPGRATGRCRRPLRGRHGAQGDQDRHRVREDPRCREGHRGRHSASACRGRQERGAVPDADARARRRGSGAVQERGRHGPDVSGQGRGGPGDARHGAGDVLGSRKRRLGPEARPHGLHGMLPTPGSDDGDRLPLPALLGLRLPAPDHADTGRLGRRARPALHSPGGPRRDRQRHGR